MGTVGPVNWQSWQSSGTATTVERQLERSGTQEHRAAAARGSRTQCMAARQGPFWSRTWWSDRTILRHDERSREHGLEITQQGVHTTGGSGPRGAGNPGSGALATLSLANAAELGDVLVVAFVTFLVSVDAARRRSEVPHRGDRSHGRT